MVSVVGLLALAAVVFYLVRGVRQYLVLRQFKGPPLSGFTRYLMFKANTSGRLDEYYKDWTDRYGKQRAKMPATIVPI